MPKISESAAEYTAAFVDYADDYRIVEGSHHIEIMSARTGELAYRVSRDETTLEYREGGASWRLVLGKRNMRKVLAALRKARDNRLSAEIDRRGLRSPASAGTFRKKPNR